MYFSLEIEANNNLTQAELAQALWVLSQKLAMDPELPVGPNMDSVIDSKGNTIGQWILKK